MFIRPAAAARPEPAGRTATGRVAIWTADFREIFHAQNKHLVSDEIRLNVGWWGLNFQIQQFWTQEEPEPALGQHDDRLKPETQTAPHPLHICPLPSSP